MQLRSKCEQECIAVGCVLPANMPVSPRMHCSRGVYIPGVYTGPRGCVYLVPRGCVYLVLRGVPGLGHVPDPWGCTWPWGVYLVPGGVLGPMGVYLVPGGVPGPWGVCTWSLGGVYLVPEGVPGWGVYLVRGVPAQVLPL